MSLNPYSIPYIKKSRKEHIDILIAHSFDPECPTLGGAVRYGLMLLNQITKERYVPSIIGVKLNNNQNMKYKYNFHSILNGTDKWYLFLLKLFLELPRLKISNSTVIHTFRLDFLLPFILLKPNSPKILTSDEPLGVMRRLYPEPIFKLIEKTYHFFESILLRKISYVITDAKTTTYFLNLYPWLSNKIVTMPTSFVDPKKFYPMNRHKMKAKYGYSENDKIAIYIGRIERLKNLDFLLKSFSILKKKVCGAKFELNKDFLQLVQ